MQEIHSSNKMIAKADVCLKKHDIVKCNFQENPLGLSSSRLLELSSKDEGQVVYIKEPLEPPMSKATKIFGHMHLLQKFLLLQ